MLLAIVTGVSGQDEPEEECPVTIEDAYLYGDYVEGVHECKPYVLYAHSHKPMLTRSHTLYGGLKET